MRCTTPVGRFYLQFKGTCTTSGEEEICHDRSYKMRLRVLEPIFSIGFVCVYIYSSATKRAMIWNLLFRARTTEWCSGKEFFFFINHIFIISFSVERLFIRDVFTKFNFRSPIQYFSAYYGASEKWKRKRRTKRNTFYTFINTD